MNDLKARGPRWHDFCGAQVRIQHGFIVLARKDIGSWPNPVLRWAAGVGNFFQ